MLPDDSDDDWKLFQNRYQAVIPDYNQFYKKLSDEFPIYLRPNLKEISTDNLLEFIQKHYPDIIVNIVYEGIDLIKVSGSKKFWGGLLEHHTGLYFIQALSSLLPVVALDLKGDESVLDMCAAPGGKTTHLSSLLPNGLVFANEPNLNRARVLKANIDRLNCTNVMVTNFWGQDLPVKKESFDKVLLDGPCSSEGTLRANPKKSAYLKYNESFRESLQATQKLLMKRSVEVLKSGGTLIYSTCTYDPKENEDLVLWALNQFPQLKLVPLPSKLLTLPLKSYVRDHDLFDMSFTKRVYPHYIDSIGFYVAKFIKR